MPLPSTISPALPNALQNTLQNTLPNTLQNRGHAPGRKIRVLVVDDSVVIRRFLSRILTEDGAFDVVGFAANGLIAVARAAELHPDAITMDIEMPELDGLETVRRLRTAGSKAVILMCSTLTSRGASSTIESLINGANDYVTKPGNSDSIDSALEALRLELIPKIKQFFARPEFGNPRGPAARPAVSAAVAGKLVAGPMSTTPAPIALPLATLTPATLTPATLTPATLTHAILAPIDRRRIVAIGVSTGGPTALMKLLPGLPANFPLPIVIVQHMPPIFTRQLADRLNAECALEVLEAADGMPLTAGRILLAPGDYHMRLKRNGTEVRVMLDQGERENSCRPAVDVLFRSVVSVFGGDALGIILTGMGQDGLGGVEQLKQNGAYIMAQDRASSVVWGMPGAVADAGLANAILPLDEMATAILRQVPCK